MCCFYVFYFWGLVGVFGLRVLLLGEAPLEHKLAKEMLTLFLRVLLGGELSDGVAKGFCEFSTHVVTVLNKPPEPKP